MSDSPSLPIPEPESSKSRVPIWLPISAFIGTSVAVAIPVLMVRRQRKALGALTKVSLKDTTHGAAPPRRRQVSVAAGGTTIKDLRAKLVARASTPTNAIFKAESPSDESSPGLSSLMSAMSQLNLSNAMFAGKAFLIATCLVTVGGGVLAWGVKSAMGINDAREFGTKMRSFLWSVWPSLASSIHRGPQGEEERHGTLQVAPFGVEENWSAEASEKRLRKAYDEGGVSVWALTALRELEAEARIERAKRQREIDEAAGKQRS